MNIDGGEYLTKGDDFFTLTTNQQRTWYELFIPAVRCWVNYYKLCLIWFYFRSTWSRIHNVTCCFIMEKKIEVNKKVAI